MLRYCQSSLSTPVSTAPVHVYIYMHWGVCLHSCTDSDAFLSSNHHHILSADQVGQAFLFGAPTSAQDLEGVAHPRDFFLGVCRGCELSPGITHIRDTYR